MRGVRFHSFGGPEVLQVDTLPEPQPHGDQVLIRINRAGVSPLDDKVRTGVLPASMHKPLPLVPGASAVGSVVHPGASDLRAGARVLLCAWGYGTKTDGTWREFAAVPATHLVPIPDGVTDDQAAGLVAGAGYLTAWLALTEVADLRPGQVVLAPGRYGAVAAAATQVAPLLGAARLISTVRGAARLDEIPPIEQHSIIDLDAEDLSTGVRRLTDGAGVDIVLDSLGGDLTGQALRTLRPGGIQVAIGYTAGTTATIEVTDLIWKTAQLRGFLFTAFSQEKLAATYRTLLGHLATGALDPGVDRIYPLGQAAEAQRRVVEDRPLGRVFLDPGADSPH
ncbi:quinone oxidoreductase family protein [Nocardia acidivorans]|uniref:quinone oxidoreductase family protein n=1 Tax=Nocardia acidivorans TaxID=404580 RepID=UPI00082EA702|nr:zinc-binding dehydrogenase [Nocardia acidivorans]